MEKSKYHSPPPPEVILECMDCDAERWRPALKISAHGNHWHVDYDAECIECGSDRVAEQINFKHSWPDPDPLINDELCTHLENYKAK